MDVQYLLNESGMLVNQGTLILSCMLQDGVVSTLGLTNQEERVITRTNQLHDSLDQLEE